MGHLVRIELINSDLLVLQVNHWTMIGCPKMWSLASTKYLIYSIVFVRINPSNFSLQIYIYAGIPNLMMNNILFLQFVIIILIKNHLHQHKHYDVISSCCILTFDLTKHAIPKTVTEVTHSDGSYGKKSRRWAWLTIWNKVKSHGTVIDWCTGREWPVNCMTVISAWWRSNMPFQRY